MANSWFRLYAEFSTDPKIQMLPESYQRRFVMLLCLRCNVTETFHNVTCNKTVTFTDSEIAFQLRISEEEWGVTKQVFLAKGLIDEANEIINWNKRQYVSDSSSERVKRHREKMRLLTASDTPVSDETFQKRFSNGSVTPPDTDTDTDTEITRSSSIPTLTTCPPKIEPEKIDEEMGPCAGPPNGAAQGPLEEEGEAFKVMDYLEIFSEDFPSMLKSSMSRATCVDLFKDWHSLGVTPKDVTEAVKWKKSEGGLVSSPLFYRKIAIEIATARRQNRRPTLYSRKKNQPEDVQAMIARLMLRKADGEE